MTMFVSLVQKHTTPSVSAFGRRLCAAVACASSLLLAACGGGDVVESAKAAAGSMLDSGKKVALAFQAPSVSRFAANGWYWNPQEGGTGFMFEAQGDAGFAGFFMYEEGTGKPIWYVARGTFGASSDGSYGFFGEMRQFQGGQSVASPVYSEPTSTSAGYVWITFNGNDAVAIFSSGRRMPSTRFDFNGLATTTQPHQPEVGWYWNPAEGGRGYAVEVQNNRLFMAMFHYNADGSPTWNLVQGDISSGEATGPFELYVGGQSLYSAHRHGVKYESGSYTVSFRNPCAGQVQLNGAPPVSVRRFVFGELPAGNECRTTAGATADLIPGVQAGPVRLLPGDSVFGRVDSAGDVDAYGISLQAGVAYQFDLKGAGNKNGTLADPLLALFDANLKQLAVNDNISAGQADSRITFTPTASGTYYLAAQASGSGTGSFVLSASGLAPSLAPYSAAAPSSFAGNLTATVTGKETGTANLVVDQSGRVTGTVALVRNGSTVSLTASGTVSSGGVLKVTAAGSSSSYTFTGEVGTSKQVTGTWRDASGAGGMVFAQGAAPASTGAGAAVPTLTVRARGSLAGGVGPIMVVRLDGTVIGTVEVRSTEPADYSFSAPGLRAGSKVDVVFTNDAVINGEDRNLYVSYLTDGTSTLLPVAPGTVVDKGSNEKAFDGIDVIAGQGELAWNAALRITWVGSGSADLAIARKNEASRLLQQATFGPTPAEIARLAGVSDAAWLADQLAQPASPDFVNAVQAQFDRGAAYRPGGASYSTAIVGQRFWANAASSPDQLRKRMGFALHQIFMVSQADSNLHHHSRAYAHYLDTLNRHAFGNFRNLLEDMALSPVMGIYLSHIRNRKEDAATGRNPDENFAREVMQLFTIGLHELNIDGTEKLESSGKPIETYNNADVMALAKVFTGWSWGFPDAQLTENNFRWGSPDYSVAGDTRIDLQKMKAYPGQHSSAEKRLFAGKSHAVTIPANTGAAESLRIALDTLFNHPNVGPFIGRQLIQRFVTSNPSPAYVARVASAFNNNGQGVRGDLGAVVRAILLDTEARQAPTGEFGKLREPVLRVTHWMRAFGATSATGGFMMAWELDSQSQRALHAPSVFGYFRPGYVPPNSTLAATGATAPELQIVNESSTAEWVNLAETMAGSGLGWTGSARDVSVALSAQAALAAAGNLNGLIDNLDLLLFAGRMPKALRQDIRDAVGGVAGNSEASHLYRARVALFVALASPDYLVQR
ncbi:DUF1800 family protein [Piscinibacter sakaiensis]|uniref:DUF1800 family protein n=1 Tax=Piscinibacter sakaiensis TaxID=1547922 RepID=UPI003AAFE366